MSDSPVIVRMRPPHVGQFIRDELLDELGLSISAAAKLLGVRRATLSDLVNERSSLTPEMALRIEKAFGVGMDMLLRMQVWRDADDMRRKADSIKVERYDPPNAA